MVLEQPENETQRSSSEPSNSFAVSFRSRAGRCDGLRTPDNHSALFSLGLRVDFITRRSGLRSCCHSGRSRLIRSLAADHFASTHRTTSSSSLSKRRELSVQSAWDVSRAARRASRVDEHFRGATHMNVTRMGKAMFASFPHFSTSRRGGDQNTQRRKYANKHSK